MCWVYVADALLCVETVDLNGDGKISYEEFKAMMQGIRQGTSRYRELQHAHGRSDSKDGGSGTSTPRNSFDGSKAASASTHRHSWSFGSDKGGKKKA